MDKRLNYQKGIAHLLVIVFTGALFFFVASKFFNLKNFSLTKFFSHAADYISITIDPTVVTSTSKYSTGVVHTSRSLDSWGNQEAITGGKNLLQTSSVFQSQHIMGWGANNPWLDKNVTDPAQWNWGSLDARVQLMRETGGTKMITLCCSPTWMFDESWNGQTDWTRLETAPSPENYGNFAILSAEVAKRYPDIKYFQVWNEMKGMYNGVLNRWDYEAYTNLYNQVYDAIKTVRPDAKIGGPYVSMDHWLNRESMSHPSNVTGPYGTLDQRPLDVIIYWLANKHGADFVTVDGSSQWAREGQVPDIWTSAETYYRDVIVWLRNQPNGGANLPLFWAELYVGDTTAPNPATDTDKLVRAATSATAQISMIKSGYTGASLWTPQGGGDLGDQGIWSNTEVSGGGQAYPNYYTHKALKDFFPAGTNIVQSLNSNPANVTELASPTKVMLVNKTNTPVEVQVNGTIIPLVPYEVKVIDIPLPTPTPSPTATLTPSPTPAGDTTPPTVLIIYPANNQSVSRGGIVTIKANATDNKGVTKVEFYVNSSRVCTDTTKSYTCNWRVSSTKNVSYNLTAKAYDKAGNNTISSVVRVTAR